MLKQIGKFTISERIGRGALSRVYRAVDQQGRPVAIKVSTTQAEPEHLSDFQRDLVAAASVLHPNLVAVHDLGFEDEFPYLVMELVEGRDLDKILKGNIAIPLSDRIHAMLQVGDALKSAHERQIFHLDVRPSKIMLGDDGVAKLLDLGLGRLSYDPARVTDHGYLIGSPFYMSPERLNAIDTADAHSDMWSFGVTFYELIAGKHPFYDDDGERMIGNIMDNQAAPLAGVPASLNNVILRTLEKDPADRFRNFADLLAEARPIMGELQRQESDALMAQALEQTDSGRWHEARRIARKLREMDSEEAPSSALFGFSEDEPSNDNVEPRVTPTVPEPVLPEVPAAVPLPVSAAMSVASDVETPLPAPRPVYAPPPAPAPKPPRPERTAPKIPVIGARNSAAATVGNGSAPLARVPAPPPVNGARMAAAAGATSAAVAETRVFTAPPPPAPKPSPARPPSENPTVNQPREARTAIPQPAVRILEVAEPSGLPWGKIAGVAAVALLAIGLFYFFFMRPPLRLLRPVDASEEAKTISPASRVIKPGTANSSEVPAFSETNRDSQTAAPPLSTDPAAAGADAQTAVPRPFDPKSLAIPKTPARRPSAGPLAALAPPALTGSGAYGVDPVGLPVVLNAPPPPAQPTPPVQAPVQAAVQTPAVMPATPPAGAAPQTVQSAEAAALRVGGSFSQPTLLHSVQPIYPPAAVQRKAQGVVHFQATITKDGSVKNLQLISGDPLLNVAAKQAVLQWKYQPAMLNGQAVEVTQAIVVKFNLNR